MLAKRPLTQRTIESLKADGQRRLVWDALTPGFAVRITEGGYKSFVLCHRFPGSPNATCRAIGTVGKVSLEWARAKAREWLQAIAEGRDPAINRAETFKAICEEYMTKVGGELRSASARRASLEKVYPVLGSRPLLQVGRLDYARLIDQISAERGKEAAHRTYSIINTILNWHATRSLFVNPLAKGMVKSTSQPRQRTLSDDEIRAIWAAQSHPIFDDFVRFLLLTCARRTEAAAMKRSELVNGDWIIPAERYKTGLELVIPLSASTKDLLDAMPKGEFVFSTDGSRPIGGFSKFKSNLDRASGVKDWTLHDLRRTGRSLMSRAGVDANVAERCLGHVIQGVRQTYDRYSYHREKQMAFEKLASLIAGIVEPKDNVIAIGVR
jgi:integrase